MPSFTTQIPNLRHVGPICRVKIGLSGPAEAELKTEGKDIPQPYEVTALIDTGASGTAINNEVVQNLHLVPRGVTQIATPSTKAHPCNVYDISLLFPNRVSIPLLQAVEAPLEGQNIQCLIGRDVLSNGILIYNGYMNTFSLSF